MVENVGVKAMERPMSSWSTEEDSAVGIVFGVWLVVMDLWQGWYVHVLDLELSWFDSQINSIMNCVLGFFYIKPIKVWRYFKYDSSPSLLKDMRRQRKEVLILIRKEKIDLSSSNLRNFSKYLRELWISSKLFRVCLV